MTKVISSFLLISIRILELVLIIMFIYSCWNFTQPQGLLIELWGFSCLALIIASVIMCWFAYIKNKYGYTRFKTWNPFNLTNIFLIVTTSSLTYHLIDTLPPATFFEYNPSLVILYELIYYLSLFLIIYSSPSINKAIYIVPILILLYGSPVFSVPMDLNSSSIIVYHSLILMSFVYFIYSHVKNDLQSPRTSIITNIPYIRFLSPVVMFFIVGLISGITSICFHSHLLEFMFWIEYFILFTIILMTIDSKRAWWIIGVILFNLVTMIGLSFFKLGLLTIEHGFIQSLQYRLWIAQLHPNFMAAYFILFAPLFFSLYIFCKNSFIKKSSIVIFVTLVFLILITYTKASWIGLLLSFFPLFFFHEFSEKIKILWFSIKRKKMFTLFVIIILLALFILPNPIMTRLKTRFTSTDDSVDRLIFYKVVSRCILDNPVVGLGLGNHYGLSRYAFDRFYQKEFFDQKLDPATIKRIMPKISFDEFLWVRRWLNWGPRGSHAHNFFLEITSSMGLLALFAVFWFLGSYVKNLFEVKRKLFKSTNFNNLPEVKRNCIKALTVGSCGSLIGFATCSMFDYPFGFFSIGIHLSVIFALMLLTQSHSKSSSIQKMQLKNQGFREKLWLVSTTVLFFVFLALILFMSVAPLIAVKLEDNSRQFKRLKQYAVTIPFIKWASVFDRINPKYHNYCGDLFLKSGKYEDASACYLESLCFKSDDSSVLNKLGLISWLVGDREKAKEFFVKALISDPIGVFDDEHFSNLAMAMYDKSENIPVCFYLLEMTLKYYPLKATDSFWDLPSDGESQKVKVVASEFRKGVDNLVKSNGIRNFIIKRTDDIKDIDRAFSKETFVIDKTILKKEEKPYEGAIYLSDLIDSILQEYQIAKANGSSEVKDILISIGTIYEISNLKQKSNEIKNLLKLDKIPFYDKKGNISDKVQFTTK
jgi:tetratricopeptide (TPR) repeat protein